MKRAIVPVSIEALRAVLRLPDSVYITGVELELGTATLLVSVEGEAHWLKDVPEGWAAPLVRDDDR